MSELNFALTLFIAIAGPILAISYLRPILVPVLDALCVAPMPGAIGAQFWVRSAYVLAVAGTLVLSLLFGDFQGEPLCIARCCWRRAAASSALRSSRAASGRRCRHGWQSPQRRPPAFPSLLQRPPTGGSEP